MSAIKASIVGASGYSGAELLRILSRHSHVSVQKLFANSSAGKRVDEVLPVFRSRSIASFELYSAEAACSSDVVFIALPSGEAMNIVPELLGRGKRIIDLGGDFRLRDALVYRQFYKRDHKATDLLARAIYGLPEWNRAEIRTASLVCNPGCYPTSALLPLAPLLKEGLIHSDGIVINSLSGVSGAGRSSSPDLSFAEVNESVKAYKVGVHQHTPEMVQTLQSISGQAVSLTFVPHLLPMTRGIYTTAYARPTGDINEKEVLVSFDRYYRNEPFVRYSSAVIPEIRNVNYTNYIDIGFRLYPENNQIIVLSAIDNLIKGAAGQAVQNMNIMFGFEETEGLL
ncbi:MAG: N-acetyl-gamma-glutamyl-phosphate reductase [Ignavibacteriales bacterium]|nr:N-acetyl-gamma-glutamyl-phosphate reductase [Ignavibacteriales bacterium]